MRLIRIPKREEGQGLVEYMLVLLLVAIVIVAILTQFGSILVLYFANITGGFTGQLLTESGREGVVVSNSVGENNGAGVCTLPDGEFTIVLADDGNPVTGRTVTVHFLMGNTPLSQSVTVGSSGIGTVTLTGLSASCPASLKVDSWN